MCSILTHPVVPVALSAFLPQAAASPRLLLAGASCSIIPDLDVIGFGFGIRYSEILGHRGLTHSIIFAAALGALLSCTLFRHVKVSNWVIFFFFLFLSTLSHTLLDMLTNGGLGVALFAPFSAERYFFPWRPIEVSPIGVDSFFSEWGLRVILSELRWVWLPSAVVSALGYVARRYG
jgi:inner membrane protein